MISRLIFAIIMTILRLYSLKTVKNEVKMQPFSSIRVYENQSLGEGVITEVKAEHDHLSGDISLELRCPTESMDEIVSALSELMLPPRIVRVESFLSINLMGCGRTLAVLTKLKDHQLISADLADEVIGNFPARHYGSTVDLRAAPNLTRLFSNHSAISPSAFLTSIEDATIGVRPLLSITSSRPRVSNQLFMPLEGNRDNRDALVMRATDASFNAVSSVALVTVPGCGVNAERLEGIDVDIPSEYICPLSQEIMTDPVFDPEHPKIHFERSWIVTHLQNFKTNPITKTPLKITDLVVDTKLKDAIDNFVDGQTSGFSRMSM